MVENTIQNIKALKIHLHVHKTNTTVSPGDTGSHTTVLCSSFRLLDEVPSCTIMQMKLFQSSTVPWCYFSSLCYK